MLNDGPSQSDSMDVHFVEASKQRVGWVVAFAKLETLALLK